MDDVSCWVLLMVVEVADGCLILQFAVKMLLIASYCCWWLMKASIIV